MASTELFGSPLGDRAWLEDQHTKGLTRLQNAQADKAEISVQQERQFANLMRMASTGGESVLPPGGEGQEDIFGNFSAPDGGMSSKLNRLAQLATQSGLVQRGASLAKDAATINSRYSAAAANRALTGVRQIRQRKDEAALLGSVLEDVTDQESYDRALAAYQMTSGRMSRFAGLPYTPELVQRLRSEAISVRDQESQRIREADQKARAAYRDARLEQHDEALDQSAARLEVTRAREARLLKGGGGRPLTISRNERDVASAMITQDFPELSGADRNDERTTAANTVASEAKTLMQKNPALSWSEALSQAYTAERGNFQITPGKLFGRTVKFEGGGKSPSTAVPLPKSEKEAKIGKYYYASNGAIGKWNGKTMEPVGSRRPPVEPDDGDPEGDE